MAEPSAMTSSIFRYAIRHIFMASFWLSAMNRRPPLTTLLGDREKERERDRDKKDQSKDKEREKEREVEKDSDRVREKERGKEKTRDKATFTSVNF